MSGLKYLILLTTVFSLLSCSQFSCHQTNTYSIEISEDNRLRFSGKGAGAGIMLSSSMGPMGIAIGVAIDEGIAKDIQSSLTETVGPLDQWIRNTVASHLRETRQARWQLSSTESTADISFSIQKSGFKILQQDTVSPHWVVMVSGGQGESLTQELVVFPDGFPDAPLSAELQSVKEDGELAAQLLKDSLALVVRQAINHSIDSDKKRL